MIARPDPQQDPQHLIVTPNTPDTNQRTGNSRKLATLATTVRPRTQGKARYCSSGPLTNYERMVRLQARILDSQGNYTAV